MLLNIDRIKSDTNFKMVLPDIAFNGFIQNACDYFASLDQNISKVQPNETMDIISALAGFREYFDQESEWERLTLCCLDVLRKGVSRSIFHDFAAIEGMTHVGFSVHDLSMKAPKIEPFLQGIKKMLVGNLSSFLKTSEGKEFSMDGNFEVIRGLSGPLRFLLEFNDDEQVMHMADRIIDIFIKRSRDITILDQRVPGWHYYPSEIEKSFMTDKSENGCINYGLSHGMAGPLVALSLAYKGGNHKEGLRDAIDGLISEFMKAYYYVNDIAYWPGRITFEQYIGYDEIHKIPGQMSWCYGSPGILRALYIAGDFISDAKTKQFALEELLKIAKMDLAGFLLSQAIVCHGFVGTAAIFNLMYLETGRTEFYDKTFEMVAPSAAMSIENFFVGEKQKAEKQNMDLRASLHNHLEGYNGVMQTILSIIKGSPSGNDKRLLIA